MTNLISRRAVFRGAFLGAAAAGLSAAGMVPADRITEAVDLLTARLARRNGSSSLALTAAAHFVLDHMRRLRAANPGYYTGRYDATVDLRDAGVELGGFIVRTVGRITIRPARQFTSDEEPIVIRS